MSKFRLNASCAASSTNLRCCRERSRSPHWPTTIATITCCDSPGAIENGPDDRKNRRSAGLESTQFTWSAAPSAACTIGSPATMNLVTFPNGSTISSGLLFASVVTPRIQLYVSIDDTGSVTLMYFATLLSQSVQV